MGNLRWMGSLDMYRKVPTDLMEGTRQGSFLSLAALFVMGMLFMMETRSYLQVRELTQMSLDSNKEPKIRVNFNITMMDLKCEFAVVDVVSVLGTQQNVTSHVTKWHVDAEGIRQRYQGRNRDQKDIKHFDSSITETLEELIDNGEDAISLDADTFLYARKNQEFLFVDFYASWCSHCRELMPTWEVLAEVMNDVAEARFANTMEQLGKQKHDYGEAELEHAMSVHLPVMVAKVDCVDHKQLCHENMVMAYPTLRLFVDGEPWKGGDYRGHRTVVEITDWLTQVEDSHKSEIENATLSITDAHSAAKERMGVNETAEEHEWAEKVKKHRQRMRHAWVDEEHPGCQLSGHLLVDRVPGNFHIQARSLHHDLAPHMANVSHEIHHLSIGEPIGRTMLEQGKIKVPDSVKRKLAPMDANVYVNFELHQAYHHYLKVITTEVPGLLVGRREVKAYQILQNSQLAMYRNDVIPEAKFVLDLSPISVSYQKTKTPFYDYLTSVMAIIGGTFTMVGLLESTLQAAVASRKRR